MIAAGIGILTASNRHQSKDQYKEATVFSCERACQFYFDNKDNAPYAITRPVVNHQADTAGKGAYF